MSNPDYTPSSDLAAKLAGTPINEPGVVYFYRAHELNSVFIQITNQETLAAVREANGLSLHKFYIFSPEQLERLRTAPIAGLAAAKWEGIERRAQLADLPTGIYRDDTVHDVEYFTREQMQNAIAASRRVLAAPVSAAAPILQRPENAGKEPTLSDYSYTVSAVPAVQVATDLESIEQYRVQMAAISSAALGYWTEAEGIKSEYDTVPLRDVAKLYAKYEALRRAATVSPPDGAMPEQMASAFNALRWLLNISEPNDRPGSRVGYLMDKHYSTNGQTIREGLEQLWGMRGLFAAQPAEGSAPVARPELVELLRAIRPKFGDVGTRDVDVAAQQKRIDRAIELLVLPERSDTPAPTDDARDAALYRWLKPRFTGYDFYWMGDPMAERDEDKGKCVIVFECGQDFDAGRDFEAAIAARIDGDKQGAQGDAS